MNVIYPTGVDGEVSRKEAEIIAHIAKQQSDHLSMFGIALEIGTFTGTTTRNIAANFQGTVITVDLPPNHIPKLGTTPNNSKYYGAKKQFDGFPNIEQIFCDSAELDIAYDVAFAFIDGCHTEAYCLNDFKKVEPMMVDGGIILLHDYDTEHWPGVTATISRLVIEYPQHFWSRFLGTSLVSCLVQRAGRANDKTEAQPPGGVPRNQIER
jgi:predicted O-methyltransferase YrrM